MRSPVVFLASIILVACSVGDTAAPNAHGTSEVLQGVRADTFVIRQLLPEELWYNYVSSPLTGYPADSTGFPVYLDARGVAYEHPVVVAQRALRHLAGYSHTHDTVYLDQVRTWMPRMAQLATVGPDSALYYKYTLPFRLHGKLTDAMPLPWYSAMAQGQMLSALVRLYEETGETRWRRQADLTFRSFLQTSPKETQVVRVDSAGYYWMEEYPLAGAPDMTLNGFIYALYGVYEYYQLTKSPDALRVLNASLTTLKRYVPSYRYPGDISKYCLKHGVQSADYHRHHIEELFSLYQMTGDTFFERQAELFYADYH